MIKCDINLFNKVWEKGHIIAIVFILAVCMAKCYCVSHPLDIHGPDLEDMVEQDRLSDPNTREIELEDGETVTVYEA